MKKILLSITLVSLAILFILTGCNQQSNSNDSIQGNNKQLVSDDSQAILASPEYWDFEQTLERATDFVECEVQSTTSTPYYYNYVLLVTKDYRGNGLSGTISVDIHKKSVPPYGYSKAVTFFDERDLPPYYEVGQTYLILLSKYTSVYAKEKFSFADPSIVIPKEYGTEGSEPTWHDIKLADVLKTEESISALESRQLDTYIQNAIRDNPTVKISNPFTTDTDLQSVLDYSDLVLKIKIEDDAPCARTSSNSESYRCIVEEILKGEYALQEMIFAFPVGTVKPGSSYILALLYSSNRVNARLSSPSSIYPAEDYDLIKESIEKKLN